ncbi:hypothetical protein J4558_00275 [Leptolyngbya sp. 15MV]|nr:hypothetical protein J4558_00275 [Leptolyngbya sp. 15MV]
MPIASRKPESRQLVRRISVAIVLAALGIASVGQTAAVIIQKSSPEQALMLGPGNGVTTALAAERVFLLSPSKEPDSRAAQLAKQALRSDPTAIKGVTVLALQAQLRGETEGARELFKYALLLSRRELQPHVWAIEEGVERGDIAGVLRTYDLALRTSRGSRETLFAPLANGLREPMVRRRIVEMVADRPEWKDDFLRHVATLGDDPASGARFFQDMRAAGLSPPEEFDAGLVSQFIARGQYEEAWRYYSSFREVASRDAARDPDFLLDNITRTEFDWHFTSNPGFSAVILRDGDEGQFDFSTPPSSGGPLLRQLQLLPPGSYRLSGVTRDIEQPDSSLPYWVLECRDGRELGRVAVPNSASMSGRFGGTLVVPANCPVQILSFMARPTSARGGLVGQIRRAILEPASAAARER